MLSLRLPAETRIRDDPSCQAVRAEPVRPLRLSRRMMYHDQHCLWLVSWLPESLCFCSRQEGGQTRGRRGGICPDSLWASRAKARRALSPASNGLLAINNPSFHSTADQTKFIALIHVLCMCSELQIHAAERIACVFELMHDLVSNSHDGASLSAVLLEEVLLHRGNVQAPL